MVAGSFGERKVGLIPRVVVQSVGGPKEYSILLTDQRAILVLEKSTPMTAGFLLGGVVGAAIASAASEHRTVDVERLDPSTLSLEEKNITIPHSRLQHLLLKRGIGGYQMRIEYTREDGKEKKLVMAVAPPPDHLARQKRAGVKPKEALRDYAGKVQQAYQKALPFTAAQRAEWDL